ncbi:hypothetical protein MVES1_000604 [Malassezia vespertilionis]|uniref:uncharacterized protein n=1 Tax=Malassezia vespertilionis TaxID=2020962 RepID=UPI0024B1F9E2|nr:uncharacterized protein MVES1_000604 [Malassezia vespertilionis]WFD05275.1 hypothetical protein MVES1_000604 [Malassezia vespertilionis]
MDNSIAVAKSRTPVRPMRAFVGGALAEVDYQPEIIEHMYMLEKQTLANVELMNVQPELHWFMRPYLVDFLVEIHQSFRLRPETLYLTMNMVDRYVSKRIVYKRHYQLVGCAALLIAAKFEDSKDRVPTVNELSQMCCNAYDTSAFIQMEGHVLSTLDWVLGHPTAETWLRYEYSCSPPTKPVTHTVARFLLEVTLFHQSFISTLPSTLALGAMHLARHICRDPRPLPHSAGRTAAAAANQIYTYISEHLSDISFILIKKYSYAHYVDASALVLDWFRKCGTMPKTNDLSAKQFRQEAYSSDEEGGSARSSSPAASIFSTPSRSITRDDDDDESLPVTPLSLHSVHDTTYNHTQSGRYNVDRLNVRHSLHIPVDHKSQHGAPWLNLNNLKPVAKQSVRPRMDMEVDMPTRN